MTAATPPPSLPAPAGPAEPQALVLRPSTELRSLPRAPLHAAAPGSAGRTASEPAGDADDSFPAHFARALGDSPAWVLIGLAALASAGWIVERRRRRELETEKDSVLWADVQPPGSSIITMVDEVDEEAPPPPAAVAGASASPSTLTGARREATLIDLHDLDRRLRQRRAQGDLLSATVLLQQHIAEFRLTSPWVFLELRELYALLGRERDWELAREVFQVRFGQRAPLWQAPSTADAPLAADQLICAELAAQWPYREAKVVLLRWILGEPDAPDEPHRPPVLALGVYRDLLFADRLLDRVVLTREVRPDSLL